LESKKFNNDFDISKIILEIKSKSKSKSKKKKWFHSCCGKPSGECPGCPEGMMLIRK
jgi:hypothetical protein